MKTIKSALLLFFISASVAFAATSKNFKYYDLIIKDYDEMNRMVQHFITDARKDAKVATKNGTDADGDKAAIEQLRQALKLIFSRPNADNMAAKLTPDVRRDLADMSAYEDTLSSLAAEEIDIAKDTKNASTVQRSTALFVLENIIGEIRPEAPSNPEFRNILKKISDADLDLDHDVINDRKLRSMYTTINPSEKAKEILKKIEKDEKERKKREEKEAKDKKKD